MEPIEFRYDTQLLIEGENLDEDEISEYFTEHFKGDCLLAVAGVPLEYPISPKHHTFHRSFGEANVSPAPQGWPRPERHPLPFGRFFPPHSCWGTPAARFAAGRPAPALLLRSCAASAVGRC